MAWVFVVLAALAAALLCWGVVDPRGQWRVLVGWSARDPAAAEPGDAVHAVRRIVCAIGVVGMVAAGAVVVSGELASRPKPSLTPSAVQLMWGVPTPRLVDRVIMPSAEAPTGLVAGEVVAVQPMDAGFAPHYLLTMPRWSRLGDPAPAGIVGSEAGDDSAGYSLASLLVSVRGPLLCVPAAVVVVEGATEVRIGVWFAPPAGTDPAVPAEEACAGDPSAQERVLLPVHLAADLDDRAVFTLDGEPIREVAVVGG